MRRSHDADDPTPHAVEVNGDCRITRVGEAVARLVGRRAADLRGVPLQSLLAEPREPTMQAVARAAEGRTATWISTRVRTGKGAARCLMRVVPIAEDGSDAYVRLELGPSGQAAAG